MATGLFFASKLNAISKNFTYPLLYFNYGSGKLIGLAKASFSF
jgi:hypothetical protein